MAFPQVILPIRQTQSSSALLISPFEQDHIVLQSLFLEQGWNLHRAGCFQSALTILRETGVSLVITERDLPVGNWKDVLNAAPLLPDCPLVVVTSLHADEHLWAEALNLGAYDVLCKPIDRTEAIRVFDSAWTRHRRLSGEALAQCPYPGTMSSNRQLSE
jgi:DNA-binding NtrC family response regulator